MTTASVSPLAGLLRPRKGMGRYLATRLALAIPVLLGVSVIAFMIIHITPGDPARIVLGQTASEADVLRMRDQLGLNDPLPVQYWHYLTNAVGGDLGESIAFQQPVTTLIFERLPVTITLALLAFTVSVALALPLGVLAATRRGRAADVVTRLVALIGVSAPSFWLALMLIFLLAYKLPLFPSAGFPGFAEGGIGALQHLILPAISLALAQVALSARTLRANLIEVLGKDYVRTAEAKGLVQRRVVWIHALRNALIPVITVIGMQVGVLLGGAVITETVFALPGIGRLSIQAVQANDLTLVQGVVLVAAVGVTVTNILVDVLYGFINPRVSFTGSRG
jgi:peptide/nickel transport system permease protein